MGENKNEIHRLEFIDLRYFYARYTFFRICCTHLHKEMKRWVKISRSDFDKHAPEIHKFPVFFFAIPHSREQIREGAKKRDRVTRKKEREISSSLHFVYYRALLFNLPR